MRNKFIITNYLKIIIGQPLKNQKHVKELLQRIVRNLIEKISNWKRLKHIIDLIEDWNKLTKKALNMDKLHRYTKESVIKYVAINALLAAAIISLG